MSGMTVVTAAAPLLQPAQQYSLHAADDTSCWEGDQGVRTILSNLREIPKQGGCMDGQEGHWTAMAMGFLDEMGRGKRKVLLISKGKK